jgi:hypothetical protein
VLFGLDDERRNRRRRGCVAEGNRLLGESDSATPPLHPLTKLRGSIKNLAERAEAAVC